MKRWNVIFLLPLLVLTCTTGIVFADSFDLEPGIYFIESSDHTDMGEAAVKIEKIFLANAKGPGKYIAIEKNRTLVASVKPADAIRTGHPVQIRNRTLIPITVSPWMGDRQIEFVRVAIDGKLTSAHKDPLDVPMGLCIVTTGAIVTGSTLLTDYIDHKTDLGWAVTLATETDWDVTTGEVADDRADRIRTWLAANYESLGIGYVLLIGNPHPEQGDIPMKMTWAIQNICDAMDDDIYCEMAQSPTDAYYSDLGGNWDLNGDGQFAKYPEDMETGGVDMGPEVLVGRIPIYEERYGELDDVLAVAISLGNYPEQDGRHRVLLPGAILGIDEVKGHDVWDGAPVIDAMGRSLVEEDDQIELVRLYEQEGALHSEMDSDAALSQMNLISQWQQGAGMVLWYGHGGWQSVHRYVWMGDFNDNHQVDYQEMDYPAFMSSYYTSNLEGSTPAFVFQISCENGHPEDEWNLGARILASGAAGTVASSRSTLGEGADGLDWEPYDSCAAACTKAYYYANHLLDGWTSGQTASHLRYGFSFDYWPDCAPSHWYGGADTTSLGWMIALQLNFYGDPTLTYTHKEIEPDDDDDDDNDDNDDNDVTEDDDDTSDDDNDDKDDDDDDDECGGCS